MSTLDIETDHADTSTRLDDLKAQCQSDFERDVLDAIADRGLRLPDAAQKTLTDNGTPIAEADFYYEPRVVVFVDGSPHYKDYVQSADQRKRRQLKAAGFRIEVVTSADDLRSLERKVST
jgi:hypothetical protein